MLDLALLAQAQAPGYNGMWAADRFFGDMFALGMVFLLLALLATAFWAWMLIDVLVSNKEPGEKILWFLVVFFLHLLGALIYFFVARGPGTRTVGGAAAV